jgi:hypothetical protein
MNKGMGIAALVIAIVAIFIPVVGPWLTMLAGLLAVFAYGPGLALGIASIVLNVVNVLFMSPSVWIAQAGAEMARAQGMQDAPVYPYILVGAQIIALAGLIALQVWRGRKSKAEVV